MEKLKDILKDIIKFRKNVNFWNENTLIYEIAMITCVKIKNHYMILPATKRNIQITEQLKKAYPNVEIFDKYKDGIQTVVLLPYIKEIVHNKSITLEEAFRNITDKAILIKKAPEINEYLESLKIGNMLTGDKKFIVKEINFFNGFPPNSTYFRGGVVKRFNEKYRKTNPNVVIDYLIINTDYSFELGLTIKKDLENDFKHDLINSVEKIRQYKRELKAEALRYVENNFTTKYQTEIRDINLYVYLKELNRINEQCPNIHKYMSLENVYVKEQKRKLHYNVSIKKMPFSELENLIDTIVFKKGKVKELLK